MLRTLARRLRPTRGFTLIELLVTVLLLTILASIAIPAYLEHQKKGKDSDAQSNARNLVSRVEACFTPEEDFRKCQTQAQLEEGSPLDTPYGPGDGEAQVVAATRLTYSVTARSAKPDENGVAHTFTIERGTDGTNNRTCTASNGNDNGGCKGGTW